MANLSQAKSFDFSIISEFAGYDSSRDKTNIAENVFVRGSQNVYKKLSGTIAVRPGQKRRGVANGVLSPVSSEFVWNTSWGATYVLVVSDSKLSVVIDNVWYTLLDSLTKTRYVFDKWWDNTEKKDRALFVNGTDDMFSWSGGYATILSTTSNTITKTGTTSWQQAGFSTTSGEQKVMIGGIEYTYTGGESTTTLTGVSPNATSIIVGATALQSVITHTDTPANGFNSDFIKVINNQVYVGSYVSRICYVSSNTAFTDYSVPTPRTPGSPELLTLDGTLKGIGVRQGNPYIGVGSGEWAIVTYENITVGTDLTQQTKVDVKPVANLQAPYAHEFIDTVGDSLVYLAQDQQVRMFGTANNLFTPAYPSFSQEIATELSSQTFTGGGLKCIGEFVYLTAPQEGKVWLYQVRQRIDNAGNNVAERLWHAPFIWNATRIDEINGDIVAFSNSNPQIYSVWNTGQWYDDSPSDEAIPYECIFALSYRGEQRRQGLWSFDKNFSEGYVTPGTELNMTMNYNFDGATAVSEIVINSPNNPAYLFTPNVSSAPSLGDDSLGDDPLGDALGEEGSGDDLGELVKFKRINSMNLKNIFEWQPIYHSFAVDAQWEILATGTNAKPEPDQDATFLITKPIIA